MIIPKYCSYCKGIQCFQNICLCVMKLASDDPCRDNRKDGPPHPADRLQCTYIYYSSAQACVFAATAASTFDWIFFLKMNR